MAAERAALLLVAPVWQAGTAALGAADSSSNSSSSSSSSSSSFRLSEVERSSPAGPLCLLAYYRPSLLGKTGVALEVSLQLQA
jgi:hypothetical protein